MKSNCTGETLSDVLIYLLINPKYNIILYGKFIVYNTSFAKDCSDLLIGAKQFDVK